MTPPTTIRGLKVDLSEVFRKEMLAGNNQSLRGALDLLNNGEVDESNRKFGKVGNQRQRQQMQQPPGDGDNHESGTNGSWAPKAQGPSMTIKWTR
ncbi:hypothetical protein ACI65C_008984 [Semiaphis heraclei]